MGASLLNTTLTIINLLRNKNHRGVEEMNAIIVRKVEFVGPYVFIGSGKFPSIFKCLPKKGVYFWTTPYGRKEVINYVGVTNREFKIRMFEHIKAFLSGDYKIFDANELKKGNPLPVWNGLYGLGRGVKTDEFICNHLEDFTKRYKELYPKIIATLKLYKIYLAEIEDETRLQERLEAAIYNCLYSQKGVVGRCVEKGILFRRRTSEERRIIFQLEFDKKIMGLPKQIEI